jgi:hypothetical protein
MATKGALGFERGTRGASHLLECRKHERHFRVKLEEAMAPLIKDSRIGMPLEAAHWPVKALAFPQRAVEIDGHDDGLVRCGCVSRGGAQLFLQLLHNRGDDFRKLVHGSIAGLVGRRAPMVPPVTNVRGRVEHGDLALRGHLSSRVRSKSAGNMMPYK